MLTVSELIRVIKLEQAVKSAGCAWKDNNPEYVRFVERPDPVTGAPLYARRFPAIAPGSPTPADGYDLRTAEGYQAWRAAGGLWADETDEVMERYMAAQEVELT